MLTSIYLSSVTPTSYERPYVHYFKEKIKECNALKSPLLIPANTIARDNYYSRGFYEDEYVLFPRKAINIESEIYLTYKERDINIAITSRERYRCVGLEIKNLFRRCWIPIRSKFFEDLLIDQEFAEFKRYSIFRDIDKDYVVTGKFKVEDGFLELDA